MTNKPASPESLRLKQHAEDALSRGFAIFPCRPKAKIPWGSPYAAHGCYDGAGGPAALRAWENGNEANIGISCNNSDIVVLDCDSGLTSKEEFERWRDRNGFPKTYTVHTGRENGYAVHLYYKGITADGFNGVIPTHIFTLDGVKGEIKAAGGYVVGAGSVHPKSGKQYEIIEDLPVAATPKQVLSLIPRTKLTQKQVTDAEPVIYRKPIPEGSRYLTLRSMVGRWRNDGAEYDALLAMLQDARDNICEPGSHQVTDAELRNLAQWGASLDIGHASTDTRPTHNANGGLILYRNLTDREKIIGVLTELFRTKKQWRSDEAWAELESQLGLDRNGDIQAVSVARKKMGIESKQAAGLPKGVRQWTL